MAVALDGNNFTSGVASSVNISVTTTGTAGVVIICSNGDDSGGGCGTPTHAISGLGAFAQRKTYTWATGNFFQVFFAAYTNSFTSGTITVPTFGGAAHSIQIVAFGVSGTSAFDSPGLPVDNGGTASVPTGACNFTTTTNDDFIFVYGNDSAGNQTNTAAGWTRITGTGVQAVFYKNLPTGTAGAQSFQLGAGSNISGGCIGDALAPTAAAASLMGAICL